MEENSKKMEEKMDEIKNNNKLLMEENIQKIEEKMEEIKTDNKQSKEELTQISQTLEETNKRMEEMCIRDRF